MDSRREDPVNKAMRTFLGKDIVEQASGHASTVSLSIEDAQILQTYNILTIGDFLRLTNEEIDNLPVGNRVRTTIKTASQQIRAHLNGHGITEEELSTLLTESERRKGHVEDA